MNGATLLTETLRRAGVTTIFSLSGNQIMPVYDACLDSGIRIIHTRHENAAVYMADAWAQVTGEIGVALVTAAPGFANALSALYSAQLDEAPVLLLSGDSPVAADGNGAFQEMDQVAMASPACKLSARPSTPAALAGALAEAIRTAQAGRKGPVHLSLAADVLTAETGAAEFPQAWAGAFEPARILASDAEIDAIAKALTDAERPLILTGPQLNPGRAGGMLERLESAINAPVLCLESPRGLRDPAIGAFADVLPDADLIVSLGKVLDFTVGFAKPPAMSANASFIVVDPEPAALDRAERLARGRSIKTVKADALDAGTRLAAQSQTARRGHWRAKVADALTYRGDDRTGPRINPGPVCAVIQKVLDEASDPILCIDGGEFGQWCQSMLTAPMRITNGLSGAIGGGMGHGIASKVARPDATVIAIMGDGTAGFHLAEFETMAREGINVIVIIGNDALWNAEHQIQLREFGEARAHSCGMLETARYDRVAEALGCYGAHVTEESAFEGALRDAMASGRPAVLDVAISSIGAPINAGRR